MDAELRNFMSSFAKFVEYAVAAREESTTRGPSLYERLTDHLGMDAVEVPVTVKTFSPHRHADIDVGLRALGDSDAVSDPVLIGVRGGEDRWQSSLSELLDESFGHREFSVGSVDYRSVPVGPEERRKVVAFGVWLFTYAGERVAVLLRGPNEQFDSDETKIEVLCNDDDVADAIIGDVTRLANEKSVLRGQMFSLGSSEYDDSTRLLTFQRRPTIKASDVILPGDLLARIERHVIGIGQYAAQLQNAGQHLKRGVLLYGPPGTGKTLTVRYLAGQASEATIIVLSGTAMGAIEYAAETARALQPAIVVLEDCDLVAGDRDFMDESEPLLFNLLDTLDGLAEDVDIAFVLTTNRADLLEPALTQRPGRVDLAAEIPLPDHAARKQLFRLYSQGLEFTDDALTQAATSAEGAPAAYAKELIRRAVLMAAEHDRTPADADLAAASDALNADHDLFVRSLLGHQDHDDDDDDERAPHGWFAKALHARPARFYRP